MLHSHCSHCGVAYPPDAPWPRVCASCGQTTWRNPLPVAVALVPVTTGDGTGLVVVRRDIEPRKGELALPGGFIEYGEDWRAAAVRELSEEAGLPGDADAVRLFAAHSAPDGTLLVFGLLPPRPATELPPSTTTEESSEWLVITEPQKMAFPLHTQVVEAFFAGG